MNSYILDSNFFIEAHRATYPFDVFPSFWNKIEQLAIKGLITSIDKVKQEIFKNEDELAEWCQKKLPGAFFRDSTVAISEYSRIADWVASRNYHYNQQAIETFLETDAADAWLIAYAIHQETPLLTHEKSEPERKSRIKIPDVCHAFEVNYFTTIGMLRNLGESI